MIYYPISTLMYSGIKDILIISTPKDTPIFKRLLGDGSQFGCNFSYRIQNNPNGLAQAFVIGEEFIGNDKVCLILGDNIFQMKVKPLETCLDVNGGIIFGYHVKDPKRYGVVEFDSNFKAISIEEKPLKPKSNYAVPGLYYYDEYASAHAKSLTPSPRGELEITDLNRVYLEKGKLSVEVLGRGTAWLDTGSHDNLASATDFVRVIEKRQGLKIACLEEIALYKNWMSVEEVRKAAISHGSSSYGKYLLNLAEKS